MYLVIWFKKMYITAFRNIGLKWIFYFYYYWKNLIVRQQTYVVNDKLKRLLLQSQHAPWIIDAHFIHKQDV